MATLQFTEEQARRLEILYSTPDVRGQREEALRRLALDAGEAIIDIGCGPGYLSESMADAVSARGRVVGIDVSDDLLEFARRRNQRSWLTYRKGDAMALPEPDASVDVAVSMQVLEYIGDADRGMREMFRVLKPGGRALAVATDWDGVVWHSPDPHRMRKMLQAWEAHCTDPRLPRTMSPRLKAAGFSISAVAGYPIINTRLGEDAYSDGIIRLMVDFVRRQKSLPEEEIDAWSAEQRMLSTDGRYFFSSMRHFFLATKPRP
jgi:ubiquinone/menaquinone biosynthesis C-methylase UbiE